MGREEHWEGRNEPERGFDMVVFSEAGGLLTGKPVMAKEPWEEELRHLHVARKEACESGRLTHTVRFSEDGNMVWLLRKVTCLSALGLTVELCREGRPLCKAKAEMPVPVGRKEQRGCWKGWMETVEGGRQGLGGRTGGGWAQKPQATSASNSRVS